MKFNWITSEKQDHRACIDLEYELRPKITKFLMRRLDNECDGDFSSFHFDVNLLTKRITLSDKTPRDYFSKIVSDFELEINHEPILS